MENDTQNDQLVNLISAIKHVSLNHQDLLNVSLEYSTLYFKNNKQEEQEFDKLWDNPLFVDQTVLAAREAIVMGMQAITLEENLPFDHILHSCIDLETQRFNEENIAEDKSEISKIQNFLQYLRKELFSRIYSQNKELQKVTKISPNTLQSRYNYFMNYSF